MDAAREEFGLSIPHDLCVVGFDNIEQAGWEAYRLTTFAQPLAVMAEHAVALVTQNRPSGSQRTVFEPLPVWRRTVRVGSR
jgi:DNA-binding LacI/PurR family transcriptional regulator